MADLEGENTIEPFLPISLLNSLINSASHNDMQMSQKSGLMHCFTGLIHKDASLFFNSHSFIRLALCFLFYFFQCVSFYFPPICLQLIPEDGQKGESIQSRTQSQSHPSPVIQ